MSELQIQIQSQLDNALPSDIIQLPDQILDFPLIISKPCTVFGQTNTTIEPPDSTIAVSIEAENVTFSDVNVKNKNETGYHGIYVKGKDISLERINAACDVAILLDKCDGVDIIETNTFNATTGIKITDSMNIDINACKAYNNITGLNIIGSSSVKGSVDSYQGFGLNVQGTMASPLLDGEYEFKVDGMLFSFIATAGMTYQDIIVAMNNIDGFNPVYVAELTGADIIIKTQNPQIVIESGNNVTGLLSALSTTPTPPTNNYQYSYATFGLSGITPDTLTPLAQNILFTFMLDGQEIQFYSPETDGTTYQELIDLIAPLAADYIITIEDGDIRFTREATSVTLSNGERFKDLFAELGITAIPTSVSVTESYQGFGLNVAADDVTPLTAGQYSIVLNDRDYIFNITSTVTYQQLVSVMNSLTSLSANFTTSFENGDIKLLTSANWIELKEKSLDLIAGLNATIAEAVIGSEETRTDRAHHINIINSLIYENTIGVRLINANDVVFMDNTKVFSNTNIGIWQMPASYNNKFRGEIYLNKNYGIRNTDKTGGPHEVDAMDSWWGDLTGPSMFGPGEGDKISANVLWSPQRQTGTIPDLSYPKTREFILGALGYPIVKVELTDEQIEQCIDKAVQRYMLYRTPEPVQRYIPLSAGNDSYILPYDIPKEDIIEVTYSPNADIFAQLSGSGESFMMTYYMNGTGSTFLSDFYIAMAYKETMEKTLGIGPAYELLSVQHEGEWRDAIRLSPRPDGNISLGLLVSRPLTEEEIDSTEWIHKYALAWAKEFLGRIRSKFGSVPGPTGEMQLDGATLLSEAQQEKQTLEESVMLRGQPLGFIVG